MSFETDLLKIKYSVIEHMNSDHADANLAYVRGLAKKTDADSAKMIDLDGNSITLTAEMASGSLEVRLQFKKPLEAVDDIRPALMELLKSARDELSR